MQEVMKNPRLARLRSVLPELYVVGGAVRNSVLGLPVRDVDLATPLLPAVVAKRLAGAGIECGMKGAKFGIVVADIGGEKFEIATFRRDIYARPRYPKVRFVKTPREDARRRDFTMNALYMGADGGVLDFAGGLEDMEKRVVRFVGPAEKSVRDDPLRILRYFRFCGEYFHENFDPGALAACRANIENIKALPRRKVDEELAKLRASPGYGAIRKLGIEGLV
jgi:poly(A) polymerase